MTLTERIIHELRSGGPKTTHDIARELDVSWNTAQNALAALESEGATERLRVGRVNLWNYSKTRKGFWFDVCMEMVKGFLDYEAMTHQVSESEADALCANLARQVGREMAPYFSHHTNEREVLSDVIQQICYEMSTEDEVFEIDVADEGQPTTFRIYRCPLYKYAATRPSLCQVCNGLKTGVLESLLKRPVTLQIKKSMPRGDRHCETEVIV